ncbi:MAG: type II toxin-antitoxin system Phd/YefM family antitoxin [Verrucomicrobia bacterium]|nr:type II toxin-antitoxin system Phd/YefM family antitoxin [Verrucomicrobiota bacterium]
MSVTSIATHEAKTHLSKYLDRVQHGETIIITRGRKPMAKLVPFDEPPPVNIPKVGEMLDKPVEISSVRTANCAPWERMWFGSKM